MYYVFSRCSRWYMQSEYIVLHGFAWADPLRFCELRQGEQK